MIFVPPLLYWSALTISLRVMRKFFGPIVRLATGLVIVTMCAIAAVVHFLAPMVGSPEAFVLGAIVSPPDPVAATAVLRPLGAPRDVTTILEGEGLIKRCDGARRVQARRGVHHRAIRVGVHLHLRWRR